MARPKPSVPRADQPRPSRALRALREALGLDEADWQAFLWHARVGFADYEQAHRIDPGTTLRLRDVPPRVRRGGSTGPRPPDPGGSGGDRGMGPAHLGLRRRPRPHPRAGALPAVRGPDGGGLDSGRSEAGVLPGAARLRARGPAA